MDKKDNFLKTIEEGYTFKGDYVTLGAAMLDEEVLSGSFVKAPLKTFNRHGLIAGATGTGKTKTLQVLAEQLSLKGVPVMLMDVKGDLSGLAKASPGHPKIDERMEKIGLNFSPDEFPVELFTISEDSGTRMRATLSEFGPVLLGKILGCNDTQSGAISLIFKLCDDNGWPLLDLKDLKRMLQWVNEDGKAAVTREYGRIAPASIGAIMRKVIELEQQGAEQFFGERSFDVDDLLNMDGDKGFISILRVTDIQDKPKMFSTFMLCLLAEIYNTFPEQGDSDKPRLVMFIDEAHLIFDEASDALMSQIETTVKLIRSKGVGLFFVTQNPMDVPEDVLGQLGMKIQHALRAFTAKDRKNIKLTAENYPITEYYNTEDELTKLGIGEALVSVLNEKGIPTPLARSMMVAPKSRMGVLEPKELKELIASSKLGPEYNKRIDRESAYEILEKKLDSSAKETDTKGGAKKAKTSSRRSKKEKGWYDNPTVRSLGTTVVREVTRGIMGALGIKTSRRKKSFW